MDAIILASGASKNTVYKAIDDLCVQKVSHYKPGGGFDYWTWELPRLFLDLLEKDESMDDLFDDAKE